LTTGETCGYWSSDTPRNSRSLYYTESSGSSNDCEYVGCEDTVKKDVRSARCARPAQTSGPFRAVAERGSNHLASQSQLTLSINRTQDGNSPRAPTDVRFLSRCLVATIITPLHPHTLHTLVLCRLPNPVSHHHNRRNTSPRPSHTIDGNHTMDMDVAHSRDVANAYELHLDAHQTHQR
jgi:hypothetical protein